MTAESPPTLSAIASSDEVRAQHLLAAMHPVCSHDLPNQAVAFQSLLQLFEWDEAAQLSPQGREYFERLKSVAAKTMAMVQYLKELTRLQRREPYREKIRCADLGEDIRAEARRALPEHALTWTSRWQVETVTVDRRLMQLGIMGLLRSALVAGNALAAAVHMETNAAAEVQWMLHVRLDPPEASRRTATDAEILESQLTLGLAREYLAATHVACTAAETGQPGVKAFTLTISHRSPHG